MSADHGDTGQVLKVGEQRTCPLPSSSAAGNNRVPLSSTSTMQMQSHINT